jgi:23S rRNA (guanine2445-N2)-methyltransferase / 23S rRNA (guanine2069-N7)-methyltransferase
LGESVKSEIQFNAPRELLITCAPGLEEILLDELAKLGLHRGKKLRTSCVRAEMGIDGLLHLLENSRVASRVLLPLREFAAHTPEMLYDQVRRIPWPEVFGIELAFRVECHGQFPPALKASFAPLKIKDAICDEFRKRTNDQRPNVATDNPDVQIEAYFERGRCELSIDLCGLPLHRRGYRLDGAEAPLREDRAAALLEFCGYRGHETLCDPFCGSGTLGIEAALYLKGLPFRSREYTSKLSLFKLFPDLQKAGVRTQAELKPESFREIRCSDIDPEALDAARENIARAGVSDWIKLSHEDALKVRVEHPAQTLFVCNPPYGERIGEKGQARELIAQFVNHLKRDLAPTRLGLIISEDLKDAIGLRPQRQCSIKSGELKLKMLYFEIRPGAFKKA